MPLQICGTSLTDENFPTKKLLTDRELQVKQVLLTFVIRIILFSCFGDVRRQKNKTGKHKNKKNRVYAIAVSWGPCKLGFSIYLAKLYKAL